MSSNREAEAQEPKTHYYGGIRWGMGLPTVVLLGEHRPAPVDSLHIIREFYQPEALLEDVIGTCKEWAAEAKIRKFYCAPTEPEFVAQMRRARVKAVAVPDELAMAIQLIRKRINNQIKGIPGGITVSRECPFTINEFSKFRRPDMDPRKPYRDRPLEVDNYAVGALHYLVLGLSLEKHPQVRWL